MLDDSSVRRVYCLVRFSVWRPHGYSLTFTALGPKRSGHFASNNFRFIFLCGNWFNFFILINEIRVWPVSAERQPTPKVMTIKKIVVVLYIAICSTRAQWISILVTKTGHTSAHFAICCQMFCMWNRITCGNVDHGKWTEKPHHVEVIKWKQFPSYWPFVQGIHR